MWRFFVKLVQKKKIYFIIKNWNNRKIQNENLFIHLESQKFLLGFPWTRY